MTEQHYWQTDDAASMYFKGIRAALPLANRQVDVMHFVIAKALPEGVSRFIDLGCGDGIVGETLLKRYPDAQGTFVDFSEPMLAAARVRLSEDADIRVADLRESAWCADLRAGFDAVVSSYAIHHLEHERKRELYAEIFDLLKPGGIFINIDHIESEDEWVEGLFMESFVDGLRMQQPPEERQTREELLALHDDELDDLDILAPVEDQCAWLRDIGYEHVSCYMKIYALAVFGGVKP